MKGEFQKMRKELLELNQNVVKVDSWMSQIEYKLELVKKSVSVLDGDIKEIEKILILLRLSGKLEHTFKLIEKDVAHLSEDVDEIQSVVENAENLARKNDIHLRGLKEQVEGEDLSAYLKDLFWGCVGSKSNVEIKLISTYRIGALKQIIKEALEMC